MAFLVSGLMRDIAQLAERALHIQRDGWHEFPYFFDLRFRGLFELIADFGREFLLDRAFDFGAGGREGRVVARHRIRRGIWSGLFSEVQVIFIQLLAHF